MIKNFTNSLDFYKHNKFKLFPLKKSNTADFKKPMERGFLNKYYSYDVIEKLHDQGHNYAWLIDTNYCVLDIDERSGGMKTVIELKKHGIDVFSSTHVVTPNGYHIYYKKPADLMLKSINPSLSGLEMKTKFVTGAGSMKSLDGSPKHTYLLVNKHEICELPEYILNLYKYQPASNNNVQAVLHNLTDILDMLDVMHFKVHDNWLKLMMACHATCGGSDMGKQQFIDWSISDPDYSNASGIIETRWDSLRCDKNQAIGFGTLIRILQDNQVPEYSIRKLINEHNLTKYFAELPELSQDLGIENDRTKEFDAVLSIKNEVDAAIAKENFCKKYGISMKTFNDIEKNSKKKRQDDIGLKIVRETLTRYYQLDKLIYAQQNYWHYTGTHWQVEDEDVLAGKIWETIKQFNSITKIANNTTLKSIQAQAAYLMQCEVVKEATFYNETPVPAINCLNGTVWISDKGTIEFKKHDPNDYLSTVLNTNYDPEAECPIFMNAIYKIFSNSNDCADLVAYFQEFMGYCIQPFKNIACWWMMLGQGSNGKSTLMEILSALLGKNSVLFWSVADFESGKDNHIMANLPNKLLLYDDDFKKGAYLPDAAIKKLSEKKPLHANPKNKTPFMFYSIATPVICCNSIPKIKDLSYGMLRRTHVIPFLKQFKEEERDLTLKDRIINNELAGVLNFALAGLKRLRNRGYFLKPVSCQKTLQETLKRANPVMGYFQERIFVSNDMDDYLSLSSIYKDYVSWADDCHIADRYVLDKNLFKQEIEDLGGKPQIDMNDVLMIYGVRFL